MASFASIPSEIRMQIWRLTIPDTIALTWSKETSRQGFLNPILSLLLVNKETRDEIKDLEPPKTTIRLDSDAFEAFIRHMLRFPASFHASIEKIILIKNSLKGSAPQSTMARVFHRLGSRTAATAHSSASREMVMKHQRMRMLSEMWRNVVELYVDAQNKERIAGRREDIYETAYQVSGARHRGHSTAR
jgi:hypothetical protein